jgi:hypothetical protein
VTPRRNAEGVAAGHEAGELERAVFQHGLQTPRRAVVADQHDVGAVGPVVDLQRAAQEAVQRRNGQRWEREGGLGEGGPGHLESLLGLIPDRPHVHTLKTVACEREVVCLAGGEEREATGGVGERRGHEVGTHGGADEHPAVILPTGELDSTPQEQGLLGDGLRLEQHDDTVADPGQTGRGRGVEHRPEVSRALWQDDRMRPGEVSLCDDAERVVARHEAGELELAVPLIGIGYGLQSPRGAIRGDEGHESAGAPVVARTDGTRDVPAQRRHRQRRKHEGRRGEPGHRESARGVPVEYDPRNAAVTVPREAELVVDGGEPQRELARRVGDRAADVVRPHDAGLDDCALDALSGCIHDARRVDDLLRHEDEAAEVLFDGVDGDRAALRPVALNLDGQRVLAGAQPGNLEGARAVPRVDDLRDALHVGPLEENQGARRPVGHRHGALEASVCARRGPRLERENDVHERLAVELEVPAARRLCVVEPTDRVFRARLETRLRERDDVGLARDGEEEGAARVRDGREHEIAADSAPHGDVAVVAVVGHAGEAHRASHQNRRLVVEGLGHQGNPDGSVRPVDEAQVLARRQVAAGGHTEAIVAGWQVDELEVALPEHGFDAAHRLVGADQRDIGPVGPVVDLQRARQTTGQRGRRQRRQLERGRGERDALPRECVGLFVPRGSHVEPLKAGARQAQVVGVPRRQECEATGVVGQRRADQVGPDGGLDQHTFVTVPAPEMDRAAQQHAGCVGVGLEHDGERAADVLQTGHRAGVEHVRERVLTLGQLQRDGETGVTLRRHGHHIWAGFEPRELELPVPAVGVGHRLQAARVTIGGDQRHERSARPVIQGAEAARDAAFERGTRLGHHHERRRIEVADLEPVVGGPVEEHISQGREAIRRHTQHMGLGGQQEGELTVGVREPGGGGDVVAFGANDGALDGGTVGVDDVRGEGHALGGEGQRAEVEALGGELEHAHDGGVAERLNGECIRTGAEAGGLEPALAGLLGDRGEPLHAVAEEADECACRPVVDAQGARQAAPHGGGLTGLQREHDLGERSTLVLKASALRQRLVDAPGDDMLGARLVVVPSEGQHMTLPGDGEEKRARVVGHGGEDQVAPDAASHGDVAVVAVVRHVGEADPADEQGGRLGVEAFGGEGDPDRTVLALDEGDVFGGGQVAAGADAEPVVAGRQIGELEAAVPEDGLEPADGLVRADERHEGPVGPVVDLKGALELSDERRGREGREREFDGVEGAILALEAGLGVVPFDGLDALGEALAAEPELVRRTRGQKREGAGGVGNGGGDEVAADRGAEDDAPVVLAAGEGDATPKDDGRVGVVRLGRQPHPDLAVDFGRTRRHSGTQHVTEGAASGGQVHGRAEGQMSLGGDAEGVRTGGQAGEFEAAPPALGVEDGLEPADETVGGRQGGEGAAGPVLEGAESAADGAAEGGGGARLQLEGGGGEVPYGETGLGEVEVDVGEGLEVGV